MFLKFARHLTALAKIDEKVLKSEVKKNLSDDTSILVSQNAFLTPAVSLQVYSLYEGINVHEELITIRGMAYRYEGGF